MTTRILLVPLLCAMMLGTTGCFTLNFDAKAGKLTEVQPVSTQPRVGNVYMVRGLWGIFSCGLDQIQTKLKAQGISSRIYLGGQWEDLAATIRTRYKGVDNPEPLVLIGHSYGADDVLQIANEVAKDHVRVDLVVSLDPIFVSSPGSNVQWCVNIFQNSSPLTPQNRGPLRLDNFDLRKNRPDLMETFTNHINLPNNPKVQQEVVAEMMQVCMPRPQWQAAHAKGRPSTSPAEQATAAPPAAQVREP